MPPWRARARPAAPVTCSAALLFSSLRWVFSLYLENFPIYQTIYGAVSAVPIFVVSMYLSWAMVLIGAVVTASLSEWQDMTIADRG